MVSRKSISLCGSIRAILKDTILAQEGDTIVLLAHGAGLDSFQERHSYKEKFKVNLSTGVY